MHYTEEQILSLAKGIFPMRCLAAYDSDDVAGFSAVCLKDKGERCGLTGEGTAKEDCCMWRGVDIFEVKLLAQDFVTVCEERDALRVALEQFQLKVGSVDQG